MKRLIYSFFAAWALACPCASAAQAALGKGDVIIPGTVTAVLNVKQPVGAISDLQSELTIIDFFATWCVPCIKALPHLQQLKEQWGGKVSVVLISNETKDRLTQFLAARKGFSFPVVVDEGNVWNSMFQPPYLPYTAVVNKEGRILAITEGASITPQMMHAWLQEGGSPKSPTSKNEPAALKPSGMATSVKSDNGAVRLSQDFLYGARTEGSLDTTQQLVSFDFNQLTSVLATDNAKKAFWINVYNGVVQAKLKSEPELYRKRGAFFKQKRITVGGRHFSLDDMEHGILRHSKSKWSLGHFNKLFPSATEKSLRTDSVDYRIHFALNCGAKSCPPVAYYSDEKIAAQLDLATRAYLASEAVYDAAKNKVRLPRLMSWFRADFGGKKGMIAILNQYGILPAGVQPKIVFKPYDWTLSLNNYTNPNP